MNEWAHTNERKSRRPQWSALCDFIVEQSDKDSGNLENKQTYTHTQEKGRKKEREKRQKGKKKKVHPYESYCHSFHSCHLMKSRIGISFVFWEIIIPE